MKLIAALLLSQVWSLPQSELDWSLASRETPREEVISSPAAPQGQQAFLVSEDWCVYCPAAKERFINEGHPPQNILTIAEARRRFPNHYTGQGIPFRFVANVAKAAKAVVKTAATTAGKAVSKTATAAVSTATAPLRMTWNIQGNWRPSEAETRSHLERDHGIATAGMSHQQMLDAHDRAHNSGTMARRVRVVSQPVRYQSCPSGSCPTQRRGVLRWFRR